MRQVGDDLIGPGCVRRKASLPALSATRVPTILHPVQRLRKTARWRRVTLMFAATTLFACAHPRQQRPGETWAAPGQAADRRGEATPPPTVAPPSTSEVSPAPDRKTLASHPQWIRHSAQARTDTLAAPDCPPDVVRHYLGAERFLWDPRPIGEVRWTMRNVGEHGPSLTAEVTKRVPTSDGREKVRYLQHKPRELDADGKERTGFVLDTETSLPDSASTSLGFDIESLTIMLHTYWELGRPTTRIGGALVKRATMTPRCLYYGRHMECAQESTCVYAFTWAPEEPAFVDVPP